MNPKSRERLSIMAFAIVSLIVVGAGLLLRRCPRHEAAPPAETIIFSPESNGSNGNNVNSVNNGNNGNNGRNSRRSPKSLINPKTHKSKKGKSKKGKAKAGSKAAKVKAAAPRDFLNDTIKTVN